MGAEQEEEQVQQEEEEVVQQQQQQGENELKYLEFVQLATVQALTHCAILYAYPRSPALRRWKTVVAPVYDKLQLVPADFLCFVYRKVDDSVAELDHHFPTHVKVSSQERSVVSEVHRAGVVDAAKGLAKSAFDKYEPKAEQCAASAWQRLNQQPLFPQVAGAVLPKAAYCTEKYNEAVVLSADKGYRVSAYLPLVPTEKIAKVFSAVN